MLHLNLEPIPPNWLDDWRKAHPRRARKARDIQREEPKHGIEFYAQFAPLQHLTVPIKFLGSDEFVDTDLATITEKKWFKPVGRLTGEWEDALPYLPHHARSSMSCWRDLIAVFPQLIEVETPEYFR